MSEGCSNNGVWPWERDVGCKIALCGEGYPGESMSMPGRGICDDLQLQKGKGGFQAENMGKRT